MRKLALLLVVGTVLASCAENKVKLEVARSLADSSAASTQQAAVYFDQVEADRRAAAAAFIARDPACPPVRKLQVQRPGLRARPGAPLCPAGGKAAPGYTLFVMDFGGPEAVLKSRVLLIAAVADYGRALAKILDDKNADVQGELSGFAEKVDRVGSLVSLLAGDTVPSLGGQLESAQGKSIIALVQFAADLSHEADQVEQVQARVRADGDRVDRALDILAKEVTDRAAGSALNASYLQRNAMVKAYTDRARQMNYAERRAAVLEILEAEDREKGLPDKAKIVAAALAETKAAQKALRNALANQFTPAQRRRIAAENLDRITRAVKLVASVGVAFS
jgi:hypothetical protein